MAEKPLVLVVDDQPHVLLTLQYLVQSLGDVEVITASNGHDAVQLAVSRRPTLVLMDVMMPHVDGYSACQRIRELWGDHPGQIWFITARGSNNDIQQSQALRAERHITKPFDPDQVLRAVREALGRSAPAASPKP